jgi:hypothetical protein
MAIGNIFIPLRDINAMMGLSKTPDYISGIPGWDYFMQIQTLLDRGSDFRAAGVGFAFDIYNSFITELYILKCSDEKYWTSNVESLSYFLHDVPNKLIVTRDDNSVVPYEAKDDEYEEFIVKLDQLLDNNSYQIKLQEQLVYNLQNAVAYLQRNMTGFHQATSLDYVNTSPAKGREPTLYKVSLSLSTVLDLTDKDSVLYSQLLKLEPETKLMLVMSELDMELYRLYQWFGIVHKTNPSLNREHTNLYNNMVKRVSEIKLNTIKLENLHGKRWEPFPWDSNALRDYLDDYLPSF